ncbi:hypothetical protein A2641_00165 [Candidatus Nomurabacteria bacterium RIFCSPHIGHO2_01_FULL_37_25]|uniref:Uncharacterized protein n=1 Tax=Candidatus Nomurabacteria bacterium RIFCSPLOWO2_01_FULL_36_16 TaxID=1801767 RepID=A0A1F6WYD1_9BACT|nr:MAG: hypothetical protein A2641_00165 [Candidatus Nomurabacteria bacterium RIFCSPHIGHO2_01_FULL_37_25]OGI75260.1 MAG: hypothetical protein A3D36_03945 [Candidatus Nomurabacteria bacterium RIFCSPHIGHO2_02_FULL_36_29]OGI86888.1 MAG: hypothetical protein A3A91_03405 [Candidatus Nomurabacteria bacterium RIFCSPLOWO2_01_FULL_36_16]OGI96009.1 MAG: hypothetical protein A3I84_02340 [Candidatus Nomurabacteria bacterium RIFCSPLOWO2_02_FULL_36_8]
MNPIRNLYKGTTTLIWLGLFLILVGLFSLYIIFWTPRENQQTACPTIAKICPDGSSIGATGPHCEFAECPSPQAINQTVFNAERDLWAFNMGDSIILYWADLPSNAKSLVFYRSESKNGPWLKVLSLPITDSTPQQVVDSVAGDRAHWYRAEALASDGAILKSYSVLEVLKYDDSK